MGVYTTIDITRNDAIQAIMSRILSATDEQLESLMFELYGEEGLEDTMLANFKIVGSYDQSDWLYQWPERKRC